MKKEETAVENSKINLRLDLGSDPDFLTDYNKGGKPPLVLIWAVVFIVFGIIIAVLNHARQKPTSPQELVVAAFKAQEWRPGMGPQPFLYHPAAFGAPPITGNEWKPGMGPEPLIYHPAGFGTQNWQTLYLCPDHGAATDTNFDQAGVPHCSICNKVMVLNR